MGAMYIDSKDYFSGPRDAIDASSQHRPLTGLPRPWRSGRVFWFISSVTGGSMCCGPIPAISEVRILSGTPFQSLLLTLGESPTLPIIPRPEFRSSRFRILDTCPEPGYPHFMRGKVDSEREAAIPRHAETKFPILDGQSEDYQSN
jgi:hypothetical protein